MLIQCGGAAIDELILETDSFDASITTIPLDGVTVAGDVRVSVFEEIHRGFSAFEEMNRVPNTSAAKGLILMFLFHTNFMDTFGDVESASEQHASNGEGDDGFPPANPFDGSNTFYNPNADTPLRLENEGEFCYRLRVQSLDKAFKKVLWPKGPDPSPCAQPRPPPNSNPKPIPSLTVALAPTPAPP